MVRALRPWIPLTYPWDMIGRLVPLLGGDPPGEGARALGLRRSDGREGEGAVLVGEGASVHPDARLRGPVELGRRARIAAGARVERAVLLDGASVGPSAVVRDSVLGPGASVGEGARLPSARIERIRIRDHTARVGVPLVGAYLGEGAQVAPLAEVPPGTLLAPGARFELRTGAGVAGRSRRG